MVIKKGEFIAIFILFLGIGFIYRDVIFHNQIAFSSHFLATFYSPWTTHTYEGYPNGIPNKPIGGNDNIRMFYPYRTFINESFANRELPLWNPFNFSGSPILANFQSAVFYPLNIIYFFLPQISAWSLLVIIQPLLGTLFMYLYLRLFIFQKSAAFLGALAFGFSGFILVWSQENAVVGQAALWFPLTLYAAEKLITTASRKNFILLVFALAICIFAGFLQVSFYIFLVTFLYGVYRIKAKRHMRKYSLFLFTCAYLVSLLLSAIQIIPSIEAFYESARSSSSIESVLETYLLPLRYYIRVLAPDIFGNPATYNYFGQGFYHESIFYIGIIPLVFAVLAFIKYRTNKIVLFFSWVSLFSILLGVKSPVTDWFYRLPILLVNTFTPSRVFFVASTGLAILSAFGFSYWLEHDTKKSRRILQSTAILLALVLIFIVAFYHLSVVTKNENTWVRSISLIINPHFYLTAENAKTSLRNILLPLSMVLSLIPLTIMRKKQRVAVVIIVFLLGVGQLYFLNKYVVVGKREFLYPDHFIFTDIQTHQNMADRFLSFGLPIVGDVGLEKHVYSPDGIDPVFPKRYGQLVYAAKNNGKYTDTIARIEVSLSEYSDNYGVIKDPRVHTLMSLLGVTRVYNYEKEYENPEVLDSLFPQDTFTPLWKQEGWHAYENTRAYPRAFFADGYIVEKDPQKIIDQIFDQKNDLRKTVILEEEPSDISSTTDGVTEGKATVSLEIYKPLRVDLEVDTDVDRILFLSDTYYPGWKATVDAKPSKIYRADFAFRAIVVPKGKHTVIFSFEPLSFTIGATISGVTILFLTLFVVVNKVKTAIKH